MQLVNIEGLTQDSLFSSPRAFGKEFTMFVAKCSMIPSGHYFVHGTIIRVQKDDKRTAIQRLQGAQYRSGIVMFEKEPFQFNFGCSDPNLQDLVDEFWNKPLEYARSYARMSERCHICNRRLENPRSKHYSIGPGCEQLHPNIIIQIDDEVGFSWEELQEINAKKKNVQYEIALLGGSSDE